MSVAFDLAGTNGSTNGAGVTTLTIAGLNYSDISSEAVLLALSMDDTNSTNITSNVSVGGSFPVAGALIAGTDAQIGGTLRTLLHGVTNIGAVSDNATMSWTTAHNVIMVTAGFTGATLNSPFTGGVAATGTGTATSTGTITSASGDLTFDGTAEANIATMTQGGSQNFLTSSQDP